MANRWAVRAAVPGDVERLAAWAQDMALETEGRQLDPAVVTAGIQALFEDPSRGRCFLACRGQADADPVATLMLTHEWSDWRCGQWWWIQSVYVAPAERRQGAYRALYDHVHALARADPGVCGLRLYVERDNHSARRTYAALGMADAGYAMYEVETRDAGVRR